MSGPGHFGARWQPSRHLARRRGDDRGPGRRAGIGVHAIVVESAGEEEGPMIQPLCFLYPFTSHDGHDFVIFLIGTTLFQEQKLSR